MKLYKKILTLAVAVLPLAAFAEVNVTFETDDYASVGVYDWWEASPFRTGVLKGNCKVVDNPFLADENPLHTSAKVLGFQRSRYGSNMFGARIDLKEEQRFVLTPTVQYVHVMMYKPVEGRAMIIGLGRHNEQTTGYEETWKNQSPEAVQFTALASSKPAAGQWTDVVFPVKGAGNIDIYSLVVVVDCESAHERTEDFVAYIDDVQVSGSSAPRVELVGDYPVCVEKGQQFTRTDRAFTQVTLKTLQGQYVKKQTKKNVHTEAFDGFISVQSGETFTVKAGYTGNGMHSFVYVDLNNNGKFDENELLASDTKSGSGCRTTHSITLPATLEGGIYRLRTKVDWQSTDPAGNTSADNHILANGGGMIDVLLNVYSPERTTVSVTNFQRNGDVLLENGEKIDNYAQPQFTELKVKAVPENGFDYKGIRITHGYNLSGDSLVNSNPQYITYTVPRTRFAEDNTYTIPASYFDADVLIEGLMVEEGKEPVVDPTLGEKITDLAQLDNGKAYAIHSINGEGYLCYNEDVNGEYVGLTGVTDYHWNNITSDATAAEAYLADYDVTNPGGQWQIVLFEDEYYLYNLGAHKFVTRSGRDYLFSDDTPAIDGIRDNGDGSFSIHAGGGMSDSSQSWACIVTNEATYAVRNWTWNDHGSLFYITEIEGLTTYEGLEKLGGEEPVGPVDPVEPTVSFPYASPAPVDGQWAKGTKAYYIQNGSNDRGWMSTAYADEEGYLMLNNDVQPEDQAGEWVVCGNDEDGYNFYNVAAGPGKVLGLTGSEASARVKLYTIGEEDQAVTAFGYGVNGAGFSFRIQGTQNNCLNNRDHYLALWDDSAAFTSDNGSRFTFTEAEELPAEDPTVGIGTVLAPQATQGIYNLQGIRENATKQRGIRIVGGKKVLR